MPMFLWLASYPYPSLRLPSLANGGKRSTCYLPPEGWFIERCRAATSIDLKQGSCRRVSAGALEILALLEVEPGSPAKKPM